MSTPNHSNQPSIDELRVELFNLPADARATIDFTGTHAPSWTLGSPELFTGFSFESGVGGPLTFRDLTLKPRVLTLMPTQVIQCIRFNLHVAKHGATMIGGTVDVRGSAYVRFTSRFDCITILGYSSWYIRMA
jgi:hypothetical protein